jgi:hypothetical protein
MKYLLPLLLLAITPTCLGSERKECVLPEASLAAEVSRGAAWELAEGGRWRSVGKIAGAKGSLCAFHYSAVVGTGQRGVDRLVIFLADGAYVGAYRLTLPGIIEVRQDAIHIRTHDAGTDVVDMSSGELPASILVDGEVIPLMR